MMSSAVPLFQCLTSNPVMAMRCMESLTPLRMPKMEVRASCRSTAPSQVLLYFSISWGQTLSKHVGVRHESNERVGRRRVRYLQKQLVLCNPLNRLQQIGIEAQFVLQLFLTLLQEEFKRRNV